MCVSWLLLAYLGQWQFWTSNLLCLLTASLSLASVEKYFLLQWCSRVPSCVSVGQSNFKPFHQYNLQGSFPALRAARDVPGATCLGGSGLTNLERKSLHLEKMILKLARVALPFLECLRGLVKKQKTKEITPLPHPPQPRLEEQKNQQLSGSFLSAVMGVKGPALPVGESVTLMDVRWLWKLNLCRHETDFCFYHVFWEGQEDRAKWKYVRTFVTANRGSNKAS